MCVDRWDEAQLDRTDEYEESVSEEALVFFVVEDKEEQRRLYQDEDTCDICYHCVVLKQNSLSFNTSCMPLQFSELFMVLVVHLRGS